LSPQMTRQSQANALEMAYLPEEEKRVLVQRRSE
jgi:hypothetical protein